MLQSMGSQRVGHYQATEMTAPLNCLIHTAEHLRDIMLIRI